MSGYSLSGGGFGGSWSNSYSSTHATLEEAKMECHILAYICGNYRLPELKDKWWQFGRPKEYTDFEKRFLAEITKRDVKPKTEE